MTEVDRIQEVVSRAKRYMAANKINNSEFARLLRNPGKPNESMNRTTLHQILNNQFHASTIGKYIGEITRYLDSTEDSIEDEQEFILPDKPGFIATNDTLAVLGVCRKCQENSEFGVIAGESGFGKTYALKQYAKKPKTIYISCGINTRARDILRLIERALPELTKGYGSTEERVENIAKYFEENKGYLIILDEAHRIFSNSSIRPLDTVRDIFDQSTVDDEPHVGVVLAGEPSIEPQLRTLMKCLANRIGARYKLTGLSKDEVNEYLKNFHLDEDARDELFYRATNKEGGCFRVLSRTTNNILKLLPDSREARISLQTVKDSGGMLLY